MGVLLGPFLSIDGEGGSGGGEGIFKSVSVCMYGVRGSFGSAPSEYNRSCRSGCFFSSHSSHFFVVPPNSQYYGLVRDLLPNCVIASGRPTYFWGERADCVAMISVAQKAIDEMRISYRRSTRSASPQLTLLLPFYRVSSLPASSLSSIPATSHSSHSVLKVE